MSEAKDRHFLPPSPTGLYRLEGHDPVPCERADEFFAWLVHHKRRIACDKFDSCEVVTEFSGLPYAETGALFVTFINGGSLNFTVIRGHTWEQAMANHSAAVALAQKTQPSAARV